MGKNSKKHVNRPSVNDTFRYAQRAMEKQDFKEALKNAKLCFRQDPSREHRQILERSWLKRGFQLTRMGLQAEAQAAARELLALGVSQPDVQQEVPDLLMAVGLYDQAIASGKISAAGQDADPAVLARAADRAVAEPASAPASLPGVREGAAQVRAALDALYAGDENAALASLADVSRTSPFADWKLFVRGLAAYYRHDEQAMRANWDRLVPGRLAARLAAPLYRLADPAAATGDEEGFRQAIRVLEKNVCGGPVAWYLESLQRSLGEHRWRKAVFGVRRWKQEFQAALPGLVQRLDRLFYDLAVRKANSRWLQDLTTAFHPPSWDPHWNRARALIAERDDDEVIEVVDHFWLAYLEDVASIPDFKPGEKALAQAMIWERLGRSWSNVEDDEEDELDDELDAEDLEDGASAAAGDQAPVQGRTHWKTRAIECLRKAISLAPAYSAAYHALAARHVEWEQEDAAADVYRRLLTQVPDDIQAVVFLFHYHRQRDELAARDYALQARRLKPASEEVLEMAVAGHLLAARALGLQGRWDDARAEVAAAAAARVPPSGSACDLAVHRAMIELKSGQAAAGEQYADQALDQGDDPADVYMALAIESQHYELPFQLDRAAQQFHDRWLLSLEEATRPRGRRHVKADAEPDAGVQGIFRKAGVSERLPAAGHRICQPLHADPLAGRRPVGRLPLSGRGCRGFGVPGSPPPAGEIPRHGPQEVPPGAGVPRDAGASGNAARPQFLQSPLGPRLFPKGNRDGKDRFAPQGQGNSAACQPAAAALGPGR